MIGGCQDVAMTERAKRIRLLAGAACVSALLLAACGDDGGTGAFDGAPDATDTATDGDDAAADIDVCALLSDAEMEELVGEALPAEPLGPDSPFIGCSWNVGSVLVQVDQGAESPVTAPGQECATVDLGDQALECDGAIQFLTNGMRVRVSTDGFTVGGEPVDVLTVATALEPKIQALP